MYMANRTSYSPFKTVIGLSALAFVGLSAFLFSFGYLDISTDPRSDASGTVCGGIGGFAERDKRRRLTGKCVCPNGQVVTPPNKCVPFDPAGVETQARREFYGVKTATPAASPALKQMGREPVSQPGFRPGIE